MISILSIGVGEGGGRLAMATVSNGSNVGAINTASSDLAGLSLIPESKKLLINISEGGSGKDPSLVKEALKNKDQRDKIFTFINKLLETTPIVTNCSHCSALEKLTDTESVGEQHRCHTCNKNFGIVEIRKEEQVKHSYIFLFVCLGGGSGSGLISEVVDICYKKFNLPIGIVCTIPDDGKDATEKTNAVSVFKELYNTYALNGIVSPFLLVDNQKMMENYSHLPIGSMYETINRSISTAIDKFNSFSGQTSKFMSTIDVMDTVRLWSLGGCCTMGKFVIGKSKHKDNQGKISVAGPLDFDDIEQAIKECVISDGFDLSSAKGVGIIAVAPEYFLQDENISKAIKFSFAKAKEIIGDGLIFNGQYEDNSLDCLEFYVFFNGLKYPEERFERLWNDIKEGKVISQQKRERLDRVSYDATIESSTKGENFRKIQENNNQKDEGYVRTIEPEPIREVRTAKKPCNNCYVVNGVSMGVWNKRGPAPFTGKVCPICHGKGKI